MIKREFKVGDQIRDLIDGGPYGRRRPFMYGYVVDYVSDTKVAVLWTHDVLGLPYVGSAIIDEHDLIKTGERYPPK